VIAVALERERRLLSCLSKPERETLIALLRRVHGNLDAVKGVGEVEQGLSARAGRCGTGDPVIAMTCARDIALSRTRARPDIPSSPGTT
jgi:hypothetical protein